MAINQVLDYNDEILDGTPRYNITNNQDGTKGIELANDIIQEGTLINRNTFNKISNVLSYLTPSVEKEMIPQHYNTSFINDVWTNITTNKYSGTTISGNNVIILSSAPNSSTLTIEKAFDNNTSTYFLSSAIASQYFEIEFVSKIKVKKIQTDIGNSSTTSNISKIIYGSNDGTNWTELYSIDSNNDRTLHEYEINSNEYYKFYRVSRNSTSTSSGDRLYLSEFKIIDCDEGILNNSFTLDNNGQIFVNNQRVLIETPQPQPQIENYFAKVLSITPTWSSTGDLSSNEINGTLESHNGITPTFKIHDMYGNRTFNVQNSSPSNVPNNQTYVNITDGSNWYTGSNIWIETMNGEHNTYSNNINVYSTQSVETFVYYDYDFKEEKEKSFEISVNIANGSHFKLYESDDNSNWNLINDETISSTNKTFSYSNLVKRYYRLALSYTPSSTRGYAYGINYIKWTLQKIVIPSSYGVESNTLNGIDIPTLLQPSTKYELIYKEDTNKFELGGARVLYDITLSENVSEIDLTGIKDTFENGKIYALFMYGKHDKTTSGYIKFGTKNMGYISNVDSESIGLFITYKQENSTGYYSIFKNSATEVSSNTGTFDGYEKIYMSQTDAHFVAGTRFIIKEVA